MARKSRFAALVLVGGLMGAALAAPSASSTVLEPPSLDADALLDIAGVELPPDGVNLEIHADFPVESPLLVDGLGFTSLTASVTSDGGVQTHSATPASAQAGPEAPECTDNFFAPTGRSWQGSDLPVVWRFRRGSTPDGVGPWRTQKALREAHSIWSTSKSRCTDSDEIDFDWDFGGPTRKGVKYDGVNSVEFGRLGGGALAINYTWYTGTRILEVDLRFNRTDYPWTNRDGGRNKFQIVNVATHELGHQIGLDDLYDPHGALTMFGRIERGEMRKTTLGAGDVRGAGRLQP